ncbi:MAG: hypothetical protein ABI972_14475 [Acidobacteriota bacterium]
MQTAASPEVLIDAAVQQLAQLYHAKGDLELSFVRQIAGAQFTIDSLERTVIHLSAATEPDAAAIDRLTRIQARKQRMITVALKELKALQSLRNALLRFPDQTQGLPPLADHMPFIGFPTKIRAIPLDVLARIRNQSTPASMVAPKPASTLAGEMPLPRGFEHFPNKEPLLKRMEQQSQVK